MDPIPKNLNGGVGGGDPTSENLRGVRIPGSPSGSAQFIEFVDENQLKKGSQNIIFIFMPNIW